MVALIESMKMHHECGRLGRWDRAAVLAAGRITLVPDDPVIELADLRRWRTVLTPVWESRRLAVERSDPRRCV